MNSQICKCCGQPLGEKRDVLHRNPNICNKCSEAADAKMEAGQTETSVSAEPARSGHNADGINAFAM
jgi:hypothetical protein